MGSRLENFFLTLLVLAMAAYVAAELRTAWTAFISPAAAMGAEGEGREEKPSPDRDRDVEIEDDLVERGRLVFEAQGCLACHNLDLTGNAFAPSLDNVGMRRSAQWLREKMLDPRGKLPGTFMPPYPHLEDDELEALVAFLGSLTPARPSPDNTGEAQIEIPTDEQGNPRFTPDQVERGKLLFQQQGCIGCHAINGIYPGGPVGPNLTHEAQRRRSDEWQLQHLKDPLSVYVINGTEGATWVMPAYPNLPPEDLEALVAFLQSLK